ncbi:MAG: pilus assembly protein PilM, partial [Syntrophales bacterium]|nr:pilus assembly protein PilM [Syntrophales bacterium]
PFDSMEDVYFDFQVLGQNEYNPSQNDVIIVAAKKDIVDAYVEAISMAGLSVVIVDVDSFALETMYEKNYDYDDKDMAVIVNIGASITNINVVKNATSIFTRDFALGGNYVTEAIQSSLGVSFEEAEYIKINGPPGDEAEKQSFRYSLLSYAEAINAEIDRSVDYFRSNYGYEEIKQVLLAGGGAMIPGLADDLTSRLGIQTEIVQPFRRIGINTKNIDSDYAAQIGAEAAVAVGLALRKVGDK